MSRDDTEVDWAALARLPFLTAEAGDLDIVELVQRRLVVPRLRLTTQALESVPDADELVVRDVEATPLLLGRLRGGLIEAETLRRTAGVDARTDIEPEPADLAVIVLGAPSSADLVRLDALVAPHSRVTWLALAGRTRTGRQLLAELPEVMAARRRGEHTLVRVPWPAPGSRGLFERPRLPTPSALAEAFVARHFIVVGEVGGPERPRSDRGGSVVFFTGLSGSGKSTVAKSLRDALEQRSDREITLLDGDDVRRMLSAGLGFDVAGREANVRRVSWVAAQLARHGGIAITALIAPFAEGRAQARAMATEGADFVEVWVSTPLEECERRDRKGLYARARAGELPNFTGIDSPYEAPENAEVVIDTTHIGIDQAVALVIAELERRAVGRAEEFARAEHGPVSDELSEHELISYDI